MRAQRPGQLPHASQPAHAAEPHRPGKPPRTAGGLAGAGQPPSDSRSMAHDPIGAAQYRQREQRNGQQRGVAPACPA